MEPRNPRDVDTFPRDHPPPPDQWPELRFDLPELRFPERLSCAAELLAHTAPDRPVFRTASGEPWTYSVLRTRVDRIAHVLTGEPAARGRQPGTCGRRFRTNGK
jgi:2-aminobenzoate-CoA ligase